MFKTKKSVAIVAIILSAIICIKVILSFENGETLLAGVIAVVGIVGITAFVISMHKVINRKNKQEM